jgi:iron complex transport system substrate-binding protein
MMNKRPDVAQKLRQTGIQVVELDPESLAGIYASIQVIADNIGESGHGKTLVRSIQNQLHEVAAAPAGGTKPRVLFVVGRTPGTVSDLIAAGRGTYLSELIALAGADNAFADAAAPYPKISMEEVIRRNPDVIVDMGHNEMVTAAQKDAVRQLWKKYSFLRAVQRDAVFPISEDYFVTPGPRVVQAVRDLRKMIAR